MRPIQNAGGGVQLTAREYPVAAATAIKRGAVVKMSGGFVVLATAADTGRLLGIAAEDHPGAADALNPRANGAAILVYDSPLLICDYGAEIEAATGGSATTVTMSTLGAFDNDDFNGGYLVLVEKAANSANTDAVGTVKLITDYAYVASGTVSTFTVESGGTAAAGDKYAIIPPVGFAKGNFGDDRLAVVLTATAAIKIKVVGCDIDTLRVRCMFSSHELGVEE